MASNPDNDSVARLVEQVAQLVRDKEDSKDLLAAFGRGEISSEQIVNRLAAQYQTGIGGAVRALAEHNKDAAQRLGERLRSRLDAFLAELGDGDGASANKPVKAAAADGLKERDDDVLRREYVMMSLLANSNEAVKSANIFKAVKTLGKDVADMATTTHLSRLLKAGYIGKERKGRYHALAQGATHLTALACEIEARGLTLPTVPEPLDE